MTRLKEIENPGRFARIRLMKNALFGVQVAAVLAFSGYLVYRSGFRTSPLYVPLDSVLNLLFLTVVILSVENVIFRALEIKHAPREGQRFLIAEGSWRGAKRALAAAIILLILFNVPIVKATVTGFLSDSSTRTLNVGDSYTFSFYNQDFLGITEARDLSVTVLNGALRVTVREEGTLLNPGGTNLSSGDQKSFPVSGSGFLRYTVTFENLANASTTFISRVTVGFPPNLGHLVTILASLVAVLQATWLAYLRPRRGRPEDEPIYPPAVPPTYTPPTATTPPAQRPWYEMSGMWHSVYTPWRSVPPRPRPAQERVSTAATEELPPPPPQVEPYEVEVPPPPPDEVPEETSRLLLKEVSVDIPALMEKAEERMNAGDIQEALEDLDTILHVDSRNFRALLKKAELLEKLQRPGEALECLEEALKVDPWHPGVLLLKARILEQEGRDDEALECYDAVLRGGPYYLEALLRKGDTMARMGEPELALESYEEALRLRPGDRDIEAKIEAVRELCEDPLDAARRERDSGSLEKAEELYRRALKGPKGEEARRELADLYLQAGREEEALQLLDRAIESEPQDLKLLLKRVKALVKRGRLADALEACERACELTPDQAAIWAIKGGLEADLGLESKATESLERALELNPEDRDSRVKLERLRSAQREVGELEEVLRGLEDMPEEAVDSILKVYKSVRELKGAKVKELASLEGVSEELAKRILKRVRKGR